MITRIEIDGFKTFSNFIMEFTPFTIIAGTNASGKSNLFDALNLLSNLADTDIRTAFKNLRGDADEQFTQFSSKIFSNKISLAVEMLVDKSVKDNWGEETNLKYTRLRYEIQINRTRNIKGFDDLKVAHERLIPIKHQEDKWVKRNLANSYLEFWRPKVKTGKRGKPYILTEIKNEKQVIKIPLDGKPGPGREFSANEIAQSALSSVNSVEFPHVFAAKTEMLNWRFLQLNPEDLRKPSSRMAPDKVSHSGANLAAALYRLQQEYDYIIDDISLELNNLLPNFTKVSITEEVSENRFVIKLKSDDGREFTSRVLSEGTLRILTLCILKYDNQHKGIICFEEPENGIHPFRLNMMIQLLKGLSTDFSDIEDPLLPLRQMIVNTHSALFVAKIISEYKSYHEISVWFSKLVSKPAPDKTYTYKNTKLLPVIYSFGQYPLDFIEPSEIAMTELEVEKYLETKDIEN
jgi:predicted ATPase